MIGYVLLGLLGIFLLLLGVAALRALCLRAPKGAGESAISFTKEDAALDASRLSRMIQVPTISVEPGGDRTEFARLHAILEELFPHVFAACERTDADRSLLLRWKGKNSARSIVLMGHQDVVPALEPDWKFPPFAGEISEGKVFGRGALDCKCTVMTELAAMEELIASGFVPACDVYFASSADEEIAGGGARQTVELLEARGVRPELVLDEGGVISTHVFPGLTAPCAVVGVTEKGFINIKVIAASRGGHSSTPPRDNPLARLAAFICEMERARPFTKRFSPVVLRMFRALAPSLAFPMRLLFGNMWLFAPLLKLILPLASPYGEAMLATTFCFTMCEGSAAPNVIPPEAYALCNLRCIAHEDLEQSVALFKKRAEKFGLRAEVMAGRTSSQVADLDGAAYAYLEKCIHQCMPGVTVAPYLMMGGTDCREYERISRGCLRFSPLRVSPEQIAGTHSVNENVDVEALAQARKFYRHFIENYQ